jgi:hypothetical protein
MRPTAGQRELLRPKTSKGTRQARLEAALWKLRGQKVAYYNNKQPDLNAIYKYIHKKGNKKQGYGKKFSIRLSEPMDLKFGL